MTLEELLQPMLDKTLIKFDEKLWHVERVEVEQTDAVHRPTTDGGDLNHYLNLAFSATLRTPTIKGMEVRELQGVMAPEHSLFFRRTP